VADAAHGAGRVLSRRTLADPIGRVPDGYAVHRVGDTWLILDQACAPDLVRLRLADPASRRAMFASGPRRGRGAAPSVTVTPDLSIVLRRYRHGGLLGKLTGSLFLGPARALTELKVTTRAERAGAPVPHVACLVLWPVVGPFWSAVIGTREERRATQLLTALRDPGDRPACRSLARSVGDAIRRLHDAGVEHQDLQLRNVLVRDDGAIVIIDLDGAVFHRHGRLPIEKRAGNLGRLARSTIKCGQWGTGVDRRSLAAFVAAYTHGQRDLRRQLRARIGVERFKLALHRMTYPLRRTAD